MFKQLKLIKFNSKSWRWEIFFVTENRFLRLQKTTEIPVKGVVTYTLE